MEEANRNDGVSEWDSDGYGSIEDVDSKFSDAESYSDSDSGGDRDEEECVSEDLDGPMLDEDTLLRIKSNDPKLTSIAVDRFDRCIDGKDAGHFIGENPYLKKLVVEGDSMEWDEQFTMTSYMLGRFCKGLAQNRSVEDLSISLCELSVGDASVTHPKVKKLQLFTIVRLAQFCQQNINLRSLKIDCCDLGDMSTRVLGMVLARKSNKSSLQRIDLFANEIGDVAAKELIQSLAGYVNLEDLSLGNNLVGTRGCIAVGNLLSSATMNLKQLNLRNNKIDDKGIAILTRAFADNVTLKEIDLGFNRDITPSGWQLFFKCLQNSSSSIEELDISSNNIPDEGVVALGNALKNNTTLHVLDFNTDHIHEQESTCVPATVWQSFFDCLHNSKSALQYIILRGCRISEEGLDVIANALSTNSTLNTLDLSNNLQGNVTAWRRFFTDCLLSSNSSLEGLCLCENFTEDADEMVVDLARALAHDKRLAAIDLSENPSISKTGWSHFSRLLCDKSSIVSTYESNHVINYLGAQTLPPDLDMLIHLNKHENKRAVAREKILRYHFRHGANIQKIHDMELEVMPHAISWLSRDVYWTGRERSGLTPLYELLRTLSSLFEPKNTAMTSTKRKRVVIGCPHATKLKSGFA